MTFPHDHHTNDGSASMRTATQGPRLSPTLEWRRQRQPNFGAGTRYLQLRRQGVPKDRAARIALAEVGEARS
jgi:hypothetical protein